MGRSRTARRTRRGKLGFSSDGHAVESLYVPLFCPGGVAVHKGGFVNETPSVAARQVDHCRDLVHDTPA